MKTKKNTIKGVKAWAILTSGGEFLATMINVPSYAVYPTKKTAISGKIANCEKIIPVLITPITKVVKNKGK